MGEQNEYFGWGKEGGGADITLFEISRNLLARLCYRNVIKIKKLKLPEVVYRNQGCRIWIYWLIVDA